MQEKCKDVNVTGMLCQICSVIKEAVQGVKQTMWKRTLKAQRSTGSMSLHWLVVMAGVTSEQERMRDREGKSKQGWNIGTAAGGSFLTMNTILKFLEALSGIDKPIFRCSKCQLIAFDLYNHHLWSKHFIKTDGDTVSQHYLRYEAKSASLHFCFICMGCIQDISRVPSFVHQ